MFVKNYVTILKNEFSGYNGKKFGQDLMAGITVAAVALPLALAFGVSSGASAAAGLVTAILAGLVIGGFSGASYQISGPTGAMTAILLGLVAQHGMQGVFVASFLAGVFLLVAGIFKFGAIVSFLPMPVITGFTSGIAVIIAFGQINNLTEMTCEGLTTIEKLQSYFVLEQNFNMPTFLIGLAVIIFMFLYPAKLGKYCPGSLVAIILSTAIVAALGVETPLVGEIPKTLFLDTRLDITQISMSSLGNFVSPAISIAALGLIESLLCGSSAGRMKSEKMDADVELIAQGIGNMLIPLFGGVPATAAIARTSVAIKSGGQTRLVSVFHAVVLLASMFLLGDIMSMIPLSALAGVLIVTAWRMNEWHAIKSIFRRRLKTPIAQFLITMVATVIFDLTVAILVGLVFSIVMFMIKVSNMQVTVSKVDPSRLDTTRVNPAMLENTCVVYMIGPLYFGTSARIESMMMELEQYDNIIFSMRGVNIADLSGVEAFKESCDKMLEDGKQVYFAAVNDGVRTTFKRCGFEEGTGITRFFWSADKVFEYISEATSVHRMR